ncbi:MAG: peptidase M61 [Caulobacteraceae bacterium]
MRTILAFLLASTAAHGAFAASTDPQLTPLPPPIAAPRDLPYPGDIGLSVDVTDTTRRIFQVRETIPVAQSGPMVLLYPKWLPGNHSPTGPISQMGGLQISAGGRAVAWTRDPVDMYAFHIDVPAGAASLEVAFQDITSIGGRGGAVVATPDMLVINWNAVLLYPAGYFARGLTYDPSVALPKDWKFATALDGAKRQGDTVSFSPVPLNTLVDSPLVSGDHVRSVALSDSPTPVRINIFGDEDKDLAATPDQVKALKSLVRQADTLFGAHHYDHYDILLWLSHEMSGKGLEHHRSSEDGLGPTYFTDPVKNLWTQAFLSHEYVHSWNGKFRRPADLWTPDFETPMRDSLLWVYEGQTEFWGNVLAARSGMSTPQDMLDEWALKAATYAAESGRDWRSLADTTNVPIIAYQRSPAWTDWQRSADYYDEGTLIWLDADTLIRERTNGRKSLDDFARGFFGMRDGSYVTDTYTFEDVVAALNAVTPYDWAGFLKARVEGLGSTTLLDGLKRGGYRLAFSETPTPYFKSVEARDGDVDLSFSIGASIDKDGKVGGLAWSGPAAAAGLVPGATILAVNGLTYSGDRLKDAITAARAGGPIELQLKTGDRVSTARIAYTGGLRYPHLERIPGTPDRLGALLAAR